MTDVKKYNLSGVGADVQIGKKGPRVINNTGKLKVTGADGSTLTQIQGADAVSPDDLVTLRQLSNGSAVSGMAVPLGTPTDGSLTDGAVQLAGTDKVTDAIDKMNMILGKLVPSAPPNWPNDAILTLSGTSSFELASGAVTNNTGDTLPTAGTTVAAIYTGTISSNVVGGAGDAGAGPGNSGTLTALLNGTSIGTRALTSGSDNGTYGKLVVSGDVGYPSSNPNFWQVVQAQISGATLAGGYNLLQITHSGVGNTVGRYVVYDNTLSGTASVASPSVATGTVTTVNSSGIPHYTDGSTLAVAGTANNLAGLTYRKTNTLSVQGVAESTDYVAIASATNYNAGTAGIPNPLTVGATNVAFSNALVTLADTHSLGHVQVRAQNPNGGSYTDISAPKVLVMGSASTSRIDEDNILVNSELGSSPVNVNAARVVTVDGDTPAWTFTGTTTDWNAANINAFDAKVVGGILKHDVTDYSTGYLPVGPNLSGHNASQYITFMFRRTPVSKFDIALTGTIAGLWVKLPGIVNSTFTANNEWRDMTVAFGSGYGCALAGVMPKNSQITGSRYTCTFGTDSSANSTNNIILVRIKLTAGQKITALQFRGASN